MPVTLRRSTRKAEQPAEDQPAEEQPAEEQPAEKEHKMDEELCRAFLLAGDPILAKNFGFVKNLKTEDLDVPMSTVIGSMRSTFEEGELGEPLSDRKKKADPSDIYLSDKAAKEYLLSSGVKGVVYVGDLEKEWEKQKQDEEEEEEKMKKDSKKKKEDKRKSADSVTTRGASSSNYNRRSKNGDEKPFKIPKLG